MLVFFNTTMSQMSGLSQKILLNIIKHCERQGECFDRLHLQGYFSVMPVKSRKYHLGHTKDDKLAAYNYVTENQQSMFSSEGEAPLIGSVEPETELATSPPYVKAPLEDRSKYEKLTGFDDLSSESSSTDEGENPKTDTIKKRKRITFPEKLTSVYKNVELPIVKNFRSEKSIKEADNTKTKKQKKGDQDDINVDSDDSIGSASDLRVDEDAENTQAKGDTISETISESIKTCGSSAYHAECESMATHEEDCTSRIIRTKLREEAKKAVVQSEDMLFVGHQYGEKPLLMDDELDSDCDTKFAPRWTNENKPNNSEWIPPSSFEDDSDVFAQAPFGKPKKPKAVHEHQSSNTKAGTRPYRTDIQTVTDPNLLFDDKPFEHYQESVFHLNNTSNPFLSDSTFKPPTVVQNSSSYGTVTVNSNIISIELSPQGSKSLCAAGFETNFVESNQVTDNLSDKDEIIYENVSIPQEIDKPLFKDLIMPEKHYVSECFPAPDNRSYSEFTSNPDIAASFEQKPMVRSESSEIASKSKKEKKKEPKLKYHLIDESVSDESPSIPPHKSKASKSSNVHKKVSSRNKKSSKSKIQVAFSNMSFEDFPSGDDEIVQYSTMPFEVFRKSELDEKKYGSKKIGNPFS